jgi:predicted ATPase
MHTSELQQSLNNVIRGLEDGTMDVKTAAEITRAAGVEIKRWTALMKTARQTNTVAGIAELEPIKKPSRS